SFLRLGSRWSSVRFNSNILRRHDLLGIRRAKTSHALSELGGWCDLRSTPANSYLYGLPRCPALSPSARGLSVWLFSSLNLPVGNAATLTPFLLRLDVALGHTLHARVLVRLVPRTTGGVIEKLSMTSRQMLALAGKQNAQDSVTLFAQHKADGVGMSLSRQTAARLGITQVAARFQLFVARSHPLVTGSSTRARPSRTQRKPLRKWPVRNELLFRHEEGTSHEILARSQS